MNIILLLPILIPFITAVVLLLMRGQRQLSRMLAIISAAGLLAAAVVILFSVWQNGIQVVQLGNWPAPFGITMVADLFSAIMLVMTGLTGLAVAVYSLEGIDQARESFGYYSLLNILLMGVSGAFLTGDMFNLYVWFEVMLIASFVLLALGGERAQIEGATKYVTINLLSSALFLAAVGILYGLAGTLNMAHLARILPTLDEPGLVTTVSMLFLVAFGIKAAIFPLFFWLPASYHTPPIAVSAIFAGLLTKVGVYALVRVFTLMFVQDVGYSHTLILILAGFTMITGVLGAAAQMDIRRILSFHIVSQIGYMLMGLALFSPLALTGTVFYIIHHIIVKTNLFLIGGVVHRLRGTHWLPQLGGLYQNYPRVAILFLIPALSLAGIPPLSGFWAKFVLIRAGLELEQYLIVITALVVGLLTLFSMTKIWNEAFWKEQPDSEKNIDSVAASPPGRSLLPLLLPIIILATLTVSIGIITEPVFNLATQAAEQLLNPTEYIQAVLKEVS